MSGGDKIRAVRNNNPGNIERGDPWKGLMKREDMNIDQASEGRFCVFKSPQWGFRAIAVLLDNYQDLYGINTSDGVIDRWAPSSENDTGSYKRHVAKLTGRPGNAILNMQEYDDLAPLVKAIAIHECGGWYFDDADLEAGLRLAGVQKPATTLSQSRTIKAATVASAITSISIVGDVVDNITPVTGLIREVAEYAPTVAGIAVLCLLGAIVYYKFDEWRRARA